MFSLFSLEIFLITMIYFLSFKLLYVWLLIQAYSLDSIFMTNCPWRNVLSLFSFCDHLVDLDDNDLPKESLRWEREGITIYKCVFHASNIEALKYELVCILLFEVI